MSESSASWAEYEKKIQEAQVKDRLDEAESFLPTRWTLAGHDIGPLTVQKYLILEQIRSPFVEGLDGSVDDLKALLWVLSDEFTIDGDSKKYTDKLKFKRASIENFADEVTDYIKWNFRASDDEKSEGSSQALSGPHWAVSAIDMMASQYGWSFTQIMEMPVRSAMILCSAIGRRLAMQMGQQVIQFSPEADRLKREYMQKVNS